MWSKNSVIGTQFWRQCQVERTVQSVPTVEAFVALGLLNLMPFDALLMLCKNLIKFDTQLPKNRHSYFYLSITYIPWNCNCNQTKLTDLRMAEWNEQNYSTNKIKRNTKRFWANYGNLFHKRYNKKWYALSKEKRRCE